MIDTGGWYKLCCPTSQIAKPDVLGTIYRVRRAGAPKVDDPRGRKLAWGTLAPAALCGLLDDPRPFVRRRAIETLAKRGSPAVAALAGTVHAGKTPESRRNAVWAAARIDGASAGMSRGRPSATPTKRSARPPFTRSRSVSIGRPAARSWACSSPSASNRRAAAEALGRLGDAAAVPSLLQAIGRTEADDRVLEHSLTFALIEIGDPVGDRARSAQRRRRGHDAPRSWRSTRCPAAS